MANQAAKKLKIPKGAGANELIAALRSLPLIQDRIDVVAADLRSRAKAFAVLNAWTLGELLGLDFEDTADWGRSHYVYRMTLDDVCDKHRYVDHLYLLDGMIPARRFDELQELADAIEPGDQDLPLTADEEALMDDLYAQEKAESTTDGITVCSIDLKSTDGTELFFQMCLGDDGEPSDAQSPYDFQAGRGIDLSGYIEVR